MSLQLAAKHLAAHGRGKDTELIHMDKGEIASLQQIAKANGGSLTINPHTGLPEAGFLSAIMPMVAGAGLMMIPGMQAYAAAGIVGGLKTMQSGSLKQGLMAGLGAYGGANMAGSFGAAGAPVTPTVAPTPTITPPIDTGLSSGLSQFGAAPTNIADAANSVTNVPGANGMLGAPTPAPVVPATPLGAPTDPFSNLSSAAERGNAITRGASFGNAGDFIKANPYTAAGAAGSVAYGMQKDPAKPAEPDKDLGQRYQFTGNTVQPSPAPDVPTYDDMLTKQGNFGRQQNYFPQPKTYTAIGPTEAKDLYHFAGGGMPVEQMSNQAMMGVNTMYPMANISTSSYGTPDQMAEGGEVEGAVAESRPSYTYDPQTRKYTAGSSMGGASSQPQDFGAGVGAALDSFSAGVARDGMTTPMGSYIPPSSNGIPSYTYNPQTRQYIQMAGGGISGNVDFEAPQSPNAGSLEQLIRAIHAKQAGGGPMEDAKKYEYNQDDQQYVQQQAGGGLSDARYNLGGYSDGGRLLRGPGDGVSDSIPAVIGKRQPARLADGEFVVPARIVSEIGNGSTEAGARKLYGMMDRVQAARGKTVGKGKVAQNSRADKYLPA
jgi:hypothetical protein